jgi:hypothetical protein
MNKHNLKYKLLSCVPNPPKAFSKAMRDTLADIVQSETQIETQPRKHARTKRRTAVYVVIAAVLITSVAIAAVLLQNNVFYNTMGTTPENAESIIYYDLADETVGDVEVKVTEAAYDGMSLFISYTIRDLNAAEPMGVDDDPSGIRLLTEDDCNHMNSLGVGWWADNIWIDGKSVDMPGMSGGIDAGTGVPGEILYSMQYRLDQEDIYLDGQVEIALPIGERQPLDSLVIDREHDQIALPDKGMVTFTLDCSARGRITELSPNLETRGPRWSAKASLAVFTPIQTYITVDWAVDPGVMQAYIDANGEGYADEKGNIYWYYDGVDAVGMEVQTLQPVDKNGVPVFDAWEGFYGNQGIGPQQAWFTFPYTESLPEELYLAPTLNGKIDMGYAIRIK